MTTASIAHLTQALISNGTFVFDDDRWPAVITVKSWDDDTFEITIQPLGRTPFPIDFKVILDNEDLAHIKSILEAQDATSTGLNAAFKPSGDCAPNADNIDVLDELRGLLKSIAGMATRLAAVEHRINLLAKHQDALAKNQTALDLATGAADSNAEAQINALEQRLDVLIGRMNEQSSFTGNLDHRLAYIERTLEGLTGPEAGL